MTGPCVLQPGVYLFDNHTFEVHGPLSSTTDADGTGVTLIFYVEDQTARIPLDVDTDFKIVATPPGADTLPGQPIPGVAIVIDQVGTADISHSFELGPHFDITGSIYALDGNTTWRTEPGDCPLGGNTCWVHDQTAHSVLSVTKTAFADNTRTPTVHADHPAELPPPRPTHLIE